MDRNPGCPSRTPGVENTRERELFCFVFQYNYRNRGSLTFEPLTLVPIQVKMMNTALLTQKEVREEGICSKKPRPR